MRLETARVLEKTIAAADAENSIVRVVCFTVRACEVERNGK